MYASVGQRFDVSFLSLFSRKSQIPYLLVAAVATSLSLPLFVQSTSSCACVEPPPAVSAPSHHIIFCPREARMVEDPHYSINRKSPEANGRHTADRAQEETGTCVCRQLPRGGTSTMIDDRTSAGPRAWHPTYRIDHASPSGKKPVTGYSDYRCVSLCVGLY